MQVLLVAFRFAQLVRRRLGRRNPIATLVAIVYRLGSESFAGCEIPVSVAIGERFTVYHGFGLVIHPTAVLGNDVAVRHGVTIGNVGSGKAPVIEDGVTIGVGASILGEITVGRGATIGAHSLVLHDVPAGARVRSAEATLSMPGERPVSRA